ncbi:uncharacterized protein TRUGW13939_10093 [Talaromyces rugulosus]|uniref:Zn(2)-C6 fungal-type domain-containing protein n=1 Tax=Talaromyces rugulosus TaxID=121627 RepID=A0A7H8RBR9_TALRU|nr:uncharacterized protein TRUGW13939_10093 [Talaromyces rugulosus]QKX62925.1 hypothetical protein TRUGW13939_10093 [Talaromyces rugulosus]
MASVVDQHQNTNNNGLPAADPESAHAETTRPRKRRRRTVACTQCRTRKLKCDREYPTCGRCLKSRTPGRCTYEDSFVWQQPKTVPSSSSTSPAAVLDRLGNGSNSHNNNNKSGSQISLPPASSIAAISPQPSGASASLSTRAYALPPPAGPSRPRFLDTVLDAPNPSAANTWMSIPENEVNGYARNNHHYHDHDHQDSNDQILASPSQKLEFPNKFAIRGKETRTRFNGNGIFANLFLQFPHLKSFLGELKANPLIKRLRCGYDTKRNSMKIKTKEPIPDLNTAILISLLPHKNVVEELFQLYLVYVEPFHRVIHIPTFRRELSELWPRIDTPDMVSAAFVSQLLLILAAATAFVEGERPIVFSDSSVIHRYQIVNWIRYAERWLETSNIKRPDLTILRIHCLIIIARNTQGLKRSSAWLATGHLVKLAMTAGYHRDPDNVSRISVFNKEMRRRMWATIVELDIQVSLDRGLAPSVQASAFDSAAPLNINDDEINENTTEEPRSKPLQEFTDCTFTCALAQSLPLRLKIGGLMNSIVVSCSYDDIRRLEWELSCLQAGLPVWPAIADQQTNQKISLARAYIETKLDQGLLAIHTPFAVEANEDPLFEPSARMCLEAAAQILSRQLKFQETSPQLSTAHLSDSVIQSAMSVLQHLHSTRIGFTSPLLREMVPGITDSLLDLIDRIMFCIENRQPMIIKGLKQFFILNMVLSAVKAQLFPHQAEMHKQLAIDRMTALGQKMIARDIEGNTDGVDLPSASQVPSLASAAGQTPLESIPSSLEGSSNIGDLMLTPPDDFNALLQMFDWEDFSTMPYSL